MTNKQILEVRIDSIFVWDVRLKVIGLQGLGSSGFGARTENCNGATNKGKQKATNLFAIQTGKQFAEFRISLILF